MDLAGTLIVSSVKAAPPREDEHPPCGGKEQANTPGAALLTGVELLGAAAALFESIGVQLNPLGQQLFDAYVADAHSRLDEPSFAATWAAGQAKDRAAAIAAARASVVERRREAIPVPATPPHSRQRRRCA